MMSSYLLDTTLANSLFHANDGQGFSVCQRNLEIFQGDIATGLVERHSGEGGPHFEAGKACGQGRPFTSLKDHAADTASRPGWMHEEGAYLGGIVMRIEQCCLAADPLVTAVEGLAFAPAAAADDGRVGSRF